MDVICGMECFVVRRELMNLGIHIVAITWRGCFIELIDTSNSANIQTTRYDRSRLVIVRGVLLGISTLDSSCILAARK